MLRALSFCLLWAFSVGCNRPNWDTPVTAYQSFLRALEKGETELAYSALSTRTREQLAERSKQISAASGGSLRDDPAALFFMNAARPPAVREVKLVREEGAHAVISVEAGGTAHEVSMVKEPGGWRIEVTPPSAPAPAPGPVDAGVSPVDAGH